jgi:hypothetical protein
VVSEDKKHLRAYVLLLLTTERVYEPVVWWVGPRFLSARPSAPAQAFGGPSAAQRRSTHPPPNFSYNLRHLTIMKTGRT